MSDPAADTIVAIATGHAAGGIGIVRLSGPSARAIAETLCAIPLRARHAHHARFRDGDGGVIDDGIALWFAAPASYTGEDVVELQAHGSPPLLQLLQQRCLALGARPARAGEFSERAYLNGKLDLAQAEAVADLIAAGDARAARAARRTLDGAFSAAIDALAAALVALRVDVEAAIDFADEAIETLAPDALQARLIEAATRLDAVLERARTGRKLREGWHVVLAGPPNAGKSSLLNALAGRERAIVTEIAGTTRDLLEETVLVDAAALTLVDTAGLRTGGDAIEREGMRRARAELERADLVLAVLDARDPQAGRAALGDALEAAPRVLWLYNKADLLPPDAPPAEAAALRLSARTGAGLDALHAALRALTQADAASAGGEVSARARHVLALEAARVALDAAAAALASGRFELAAEDLRRAHDALGAITGCTTPDGLLGEIFSRFCIGK